MTREGEALRAVPQFASRRFAASANCQAIADVHRVATGTPTALSLSLTGGAGWCGGFTMTREKTR